MKTIGSVSKTVLKKKVVCVRADCVNSAYASTACVQLVLNVSVLGAVFVIVDVTGHSVRQWFWCNISRHTANIQPISRSLQSRMAQ